MTWLIIGAGISGLGACQLLKSKGYNVAITDDSNIQNDFANLADFILTPKEASELLESKLEGVILSPGIKESHPLYQKALKTSQHILSEVDLSTRYFQGKIIGVTGTNGKSTTVSMIAHCLKKLGLNAVACGNIGTPLSTLIAKNDIPEIAVMELSSYQLLQSRAIKVDVAVFFNFSKDHIERHLNIQNYFQAKWRLIDFTKSPQSVLISNEIKQCARSFNLKLDDSYQILNPDGDFLQKTTFLAPHNQQNAFYSLHAIKALTNHEPTSLIPSLQSFETLPHRFETIATINDCQIINDSKATNVDSTLIALQTISKPAILLLGGLGKNESFMPILEYKDKIKKIYAFGKSASEIYSELNGNIEIIKYATLNELLKAFIDRTIKIDHPILLSPGCASFDEFKNFSERGQFFTRTMQFIEKEYDS